MIAISKGQTFQERRKELILTVLTSALMVRKAVLSQTAGILTYTKLEAPNYTGNR